MCTYLRSDGTAAGAMADLMCLVANMVNAGWELEHTALEQPEQRRLCLVGVCQRCGGRLCLGLRITDGLDRNDLLAEIYRHMRQISHNFGLSRSSREMFVELFHEEDQPFVREWLKRPENRDVAQMYRGKKDIDAAAAPERGGLCDGKHDQDARYFDAVPSTGTILRRNEHGKHTGTNLLWLPL